MTEAIEFVGGPLDGETHEVGAAVGQVTRMACTVPQQMATYERRISPASGEVRMVWVGVRGVRQK